MSLLEWLDMRKRLADCEANLANTVAVGTREILENMDNRLRIDLLEGQVEFLRKLLADAGIAVDPEKDYFEEMLRRGRERNED